MKLQISSAPPRVIARQHVRADARAQTSAEADNALARRTPDDWPDDFGPYPNRRTRRARPPRHAATGTVTEHQGRSDAPAGRTARAKRVRTARAFKRAARRESRVAA